MSFSPPPWRRRALAIATAALIALLVTLTPTETARAASTWRWPVEPAHVVNAFDPPEHPWESGHRGVDLAASIGQEIHAPTDGSVTFAGVIAGRGVVVVSHGAVRTTYEPVQSRVTVGTSVEAGDVLGTLQAFAHHCSSPCLHWGAIQGDTYLDPTSFVVPKPSRLLPLWADAPRLPAADPPLVAQRPQSAPTVGGSVGMTSTGSPEPTEVAAAAVTLVGARASGEVDAARASESPEGSTAGGADASEPQSAAGPRHSDETWIGRTPGAWATVAGLALCLATLVALDARARRRLVGAAPGSARPRRRTAGRSRDAPTDRS